MRDDLDSKPPIVGHDNHHSSNRLGAASRSCRTRAPQPPLSTAVIRARHGLPDMEGDPRIPRTAASLLQAIFPFERF